MSEATLEDKKKATDAFNTIVKTETLVLEKKHLRSREEMIEELVRQKARLAITQKRYRKINQLTPKKQKKKLEKDVLVAGLAVQILNWLFVEDE